jgi:hypothetical protein|tara:strand:- start:12021 stop:12491 length:471 start_codon:yes stop_codon:yes gene_type:complete
VIAELIAANNPAARPVSVDESAVHFLSENDVPEWIVRSLTATAYDEWMPLQNHFIAPVNLLRDLNNEDLYRPWFHRRYLTVGGGLNGDPIAIDLNTHRMCFLFHDEMYPREDYLPDDFVLHTPLTYTDFWTGVANDPSFPVDAYEAEECWGRPQRS